MSKIDFVKDLKNAQLERDVEQVYNNGISFYFPNVDIEHPFACDGLITTKENDKLLKLIIEYKFDELFSSKFVRAKVITQVIYYIKQIENAGMILPNVVLVGDKNECFCFHSNCILKYLDYDCDWSIAPSRAGLVNLDMVNAIAADEEVNPFVFDIKEGFDFELVANKIKDLASNVQRYVHITEHNIAAIYETFLNRVVRNQKKMSSHDLVGIFMGVITNGDEYYKHPTKKNILVTPHKNVEIDSSAFDAFFSYFQRKYTPQEKNNFAAIADRLIEDTDRRNSGDYFTPTNYTDYAHKMISKQLGEDWKEKYVVWDNCYDIETEFLSQYGWKRISDYQQGDLVMQYNMDGTANFVEPLRYIKQRYNGKWVRLIGSQLDIKCTTDHNFVVQKDYGDRRSIIEKIPAIDVYNKSKMVKNLHLNMLKTFSYDGNIDIDENILRLAIAINADGTYTPLTTLGNNKGRTKRNTRFTCKDTSIRDCYFVSVKKERKKERMQMLLENAHIDYKLSFVRGGYSVFTFHFPFNPKHFPMEWFNLSNKSKEVFIDEIFYWDGSMVKQTFANGRTNIRKSYSTSKRDDAELVSFIFASMGYGVNYRTDIRENKTNYKANYQLSITKISKAKICSKNNKFYLEDSAENDYTYCFQVPSGMLVIKRNDKIYIGSNCSGTHNLTRDYHFNELYCSTLFESELEIGKRYNQEATKFQFDFLNDYFPMNGDLHNADSKVPQGLINALKEDKPIVFFLNPPYATAGNWDETSKKDVAKTQVNTQMLKDNMGACAQNLYAQFLYRIMMIKKSYNLTNCHIALFSPSLFLSGGSYKKFRAAFLNEFEYKDAFLMCASEFADCASNWGINFTFWNNGVTADKENFAMSVVGRNANGEIERVADKIIYNVDSTKTASEWAKEPIKGLKTFDMPHLSSGIIVKGKCGNGINGMYGYLFSKCNNIDSNSMNVGLFSSIYSDGHGISMIEDNFTRCTALFAARKLIVGDWTNSKDEYIAPNTEDVRYREFELDSVVYSLFNTSSNQSSLRNIEYKGKQWNIKNEFYFMGKSEMESLANDNGNDECFEDARVSEDRFVYKFLREHRNELSAEALRVLEKAEELVGVSFKYRLMFDEEKPEYQINNWDAGWYQIKGLLKMYMPEELKAFQTLYKGLSDKMRPMVYELGFLKK